MIVLIRHGETHGTQGLYVGRGTDAPLSDAGREQALALARTLPAALPDAARGSLFCSPLIRCRDTARPLAGALGLAPVVLDDLAEIDLGDWEGRTMQAVRREHPGAHAARGRDFAGFRPPGGENFADLRERALAALAVLAAAPFPALAVTHAGIIRVLACHALGTPLDNLFRLRPRHCRAMILCPKGDGYALEAFNTLDAPPVGG